MTVIFRDQDDRELSEADLEGFVGTVRWEVPSEIEIPERAMELFQEGRAAGTQADYPRALKLFEEAAAIAPEWPYPVYDTGFTYLHMQDFAKALDYFERTLVLAPRGFFIALAGLWAQRRAGEDTPMTGLRVVLIVIAVWVVVPRPLSAQDPSYHALPTLGPDADPKDARAYYQRGIELVDGSTKESIPFFYWAARLDPTWAQPLYAQWVAEHLSSQDFRHYYSTQLRSQLSDLDRELLNSPEVQRIDSLMLRAYQRNPFFFRSLDYLWPKHFSGAFVLAIAADTSAWAKGWVAYVGRRFDASLQAYARLLDVEEDNASVHFARGQIFMLTKQYDSAYVAFEAALEELRQRDESEVVLLYQSKAVLEFCAGWALEASAKLDVASEAYARALIEDLSFYPAHQRLGAIGLAVGDTAAALIEFELAVESNPTEPVPRVFLGFVLYRVGRYTEAIETLEAVLNLESYWSEPHYVMGMAFEALGDAERAVVSYETFAALAKETDQRQATVAQKIERLKIPQP